MRRLVSVLAVAALGLALVACSSSESDGGSTEDGVTTTSAYFGDGTDDATSTTATDGSTTTSAADEGATDGDLVGTWTADAADLLAANTANLGGPGAVTCLGPVSLELADDGTFTHTGDITCEVPGGPAASGTITSTGRWSADGTTVTLSDTSTTSEVEGISQLIGDASAAYVVDGDTLTVTFAFDPVGEVSQVYTRA